MKHDVTDLNRGAEEAPLGSDSVGFEPRGKASRLKTWLYPKSTLQTTLIIGAAFFVMLFVGLVGFLFVQDATRWGKFPPRSKVSGVDVSGLSKKDAISKCEKELLPIEQKPVTLTLDSLKYTAQPAELGLHLDYAKMVNQAYRQAWAPNLLARMYTSFVNRPKTVNGIILADNNDALVSQFVAKVTKRVNQRPRNAYVDVTNGTPAIVDGRNGYQVPADTIKQEVVAAENSKARTVEIKATKTLATFRADQFHKLIIVDLSQHLLTLYDRETPLAQFPIACGQPAYPTPVGQWQIVGKQMNPTWINPHDAWSATMPDTIPPGYNNPLGLRAMPLDASGVLIHGTANDASIGTSASHGCMRMHMPDVIKLFDMVTVGTPVYIIQAAGNPGFNVAATAPWMRHSGSPGSVQYTGD
jgi:lipoprotein-anchoring transpeptidase ErfK/SrfK